ncbi:MAG: hypothetical protein Kow0098_26710 [Ignavibacteriaceae bacterium]
MQKTFFVLLIIFMGGLNTIFAQYPNVRVSNPSSTTPEEVTIAINPLNPDILAAGANISYFYRSTNAGLSWSQTNLSSSLGVWGDPCVLFDSLGYLYYAHLSNPVAGYWIDRIVIQRSTDTGLNWNDGAGVGYNYPKNQDKEWLAVDMTNSPYRDNVYVAWTEFDDYGSFNSNDSSRILFSRSTDHGITWSDPVRLSDTGGNCIDSDETVEGAVPAVGPEGQVYVAWAGPLGIMFDKSTDGGETFGQDIYISDMPGGWDISVPGIYRCNGMPVTACDISNSPFRGTVYVCWADQRNGSDNTDIFLSRSFDEGETWSEPVKINDDISARHQFFVWMSVDPKTGVIYTVFYDRRNTTGAVTDVYIARSTDGGSTFENFKVSETSFLPDASVFFGDYTNIAAFDGKVYPIWMRMDGFNLSVWTAIIEDTSSVIPVELKSFSAVSENGKVNLYWATASELNNYGFEVYRKSPGSDDWILIGFVNGNGTTTEETFYRFSDDPGKSGIYAYRLKQIDFDGSSVYSNIVEIKVIIADDFILFQNYPNPFNPSTTIGFQLPEQVYVTLKVYNVLGQELKTLAEGVFNAGIHEVEFSPVDIGSGLYLYKLSVGNNTFTKKMMFMK